MSLRETVAEVFTGPRRYDRERRRDHEDADQRADRLPWKSPGTTSSGTARAYSKRSRPVGFGGTSRVPVAALRRFPQAVHDLRAVGSGRVAQTRGPVRDGRRRGERGGRVGPRRRRGWRRNESLRSTHPRYDR